MLENRFRSALSDANLQAIMKVSTASFTPDFKRLVPNCRQLHLSYSCMKFLLNESVKKMV